jgi:hypothetical protein
MQKVMRRTLGVGGATAVALAASLALAGVASAHTPKFTPGCLDNGQATLTVNLQAYTQPQKNSDPNTITVSYAPNGGKAQTVLATTDFGSSYTPKPLTVDGTTAGTFTIVVTAWDDPKGKNSVANVGEPAAWDGTFTRKTTVCQQPPTKTTTAPPTTTTTSTTPPTSSSAPTTTTAAVAPVSDKTATPPGGLAYTGVSTELPLIIAGVLIVLGAGALITMRVLKRRRAES